MLRVEIKMAILYVTAILASSSPKSFFPCPTYPFWPKLWLPRKTRWSGRHPGPRCRIAGHWNCERLFCRTSGFQR